MVGVPRKPAPPIDWKDEDPTSRGALFPIEWNERTGDNRLAAPQALLDLINAILLPGKALSGDFNQVEVNMDTGDVSPMDPRLVDEAANAALAIGTPSASVASTMQPDPNLLNIFAGARSKTADIDKLNKAQELTKGFSNKNVDAGSQPGITAEQVEEIFGATGWFPGVDNKWKYEIPDNLRIRAGMPDVATPYGKALERINTRDPWYDPAKQTNPEFARRYAAENRIMAAGDTPAVTRSGTAAQFIDHPELFAAYPELAELGTKVTGKPLEKQNGVFYPPGYLGNSSPRIEASGFTPEDITSVMLHELQHSVQDVEGFATGGNPNFAGQALARLSSDPATQLEMADPFLIYRALMGEVEARQVQSRYELGTAESVQGGPYPSSSVSASIPPTLTGGDLGMDIPRHLQLNPLWLDNPSITPGPEGYGSASALVTKLKQLKKELGL